MNGVNSINNLYQSILSGILPDKQPQNREDAQKVVQELNEQMESMVNTLVNGGNLNLTPNPLDNFAMTLQMLEEAGQINTEDVTQLYQQFESMYNLINSFNTTA